MDWETWFRVANLAAMAGWIALIFLPRWASLRAGLRFGLIAALAVAYTALAFVHFSSAPGGGFSSLAGVAALFAQPPVLLAGWIHYLAFDLFVGTWIAERADARGLSRFIQAPILAATFMLGPLGYLLYIATEALPRRQTENA